jgi:hypothetical protein
VAGEHEWADGECNHGPLVETEKEKPILNKSPCMGTYISLESLQVIECSYKHYCYKKLISNLILIKDCNPILFPP